MSDLFHPEVPIDYIRATLQVMRMAKWHHFQILTKRAERMKELMNDQLAKYATLSNVWLGVSVENKRQGLPRIQLLRETSAQIRFLSIEPLLEDLGTIDLGMIDWVIVGGESGHDHRPIEESWVISIKDQCHDAGVPFFFKQWGGRTAKAGGRLLQGKTYDQFPPYKFGPVPNRKERRRMIDKVESWYPSPINERRLIDPRTETLTRGQ